MSNHNNESDQSEDLGISDDQLPEDLQPDENPLAEGLEAGESAGDLLEEGNPAQEPSGEESEDS